MKEKSAYRIAEEMENAICCGFSKKSFPYFSDILGSDWASGKDFNGEVDRYIDYAYEVAERKYGELPWKIDFEYLRELNS